MPDDMPRALRNRPVDDVGRPVPFFVQYVDGKPDFRIMSADSYRACMMMGLCWTCGERLKRGTGTFVVGPMCVLNGTSAEPPSHYACGHWSARACPFLNNPGKVRREGGLDQLDVADVAGIMIARNPGVIALATSDRWRSFNVPNGVLYNFIPKSVEWMSQGREATDDEVWWSVETGIRALIDMADEEGDGARDALRIQTMQRIAQWFPERPEGDFPNIDAAVSV